jgi:NarL family two-component system sensor histidine kinase YdfH
MKAISEGLTNIARHAQAQQVILRVRMDDHALEVFLKDDGAGFAVDQRVGREGHYGLVGLRERARLVGGSLKVDSEAGEGTTLILRIPLEGNEI